MTRIEEIEARLAAATPGEWEAQPQEYDYARVQVHGKTYKDHNGTKTPIIVDGASVQDAALIAAAPSDLRYLIARVRELETELDTRPHITPEDAAQHVAKGMGRPYDRAAVTRVYDSMYAHAKKVK